jgi:hypothetical protein
MGAQPVACTATIRGRLLPIKPIASNSAKAFPHADQAGAAARWIEDHVRKLPAELLGQFQAHRLLALDPVRLLQGRDIEPSGDLSALPDELPAIVDQPVDAIDGCSLQGDLGKVDLGRVLRAEDRRTDTRAARIGRESSSGIAVAGHRQMLDAERLGHGYRHHKASRLE